MTVAELIAKREPDWRELEELVRELNKPTFRRRVSPDAVARFTSLYRAACSDLAVAESYQLPPATVARLNGLVGLAHNCLYRRRRSRGASWLQLFIFDAPRWVLTDVAFWISLILFWGCFLVTMFLGKFDPGFAEDLVGEGNLKRMVDMYSDSFSSDFIARLPMVAFYIAHNAGIGLKTFAFGILGMIPGAVILVSNALSLGTIYGYMHSAACPEFAANNFREFTTAHGPFELTAIVLAAAAGMRMGMGLILTRGYARLDSLRRATIKAAPAMLLSFVFFCVAACLEAFVSPNPMTWLEGSPTSPKDVKLLVALLSTTFLLVYFLAFGLFSISQIYRGLSFREALRYFWNAATDVQVSRVRLDKTTSSSTSGASGAPGSSESA